MPPARRIYRHAARLVLLSALVAVQFGCEPSRHAGDGARAALTRADARWSSLTPAERTAVAELAAAPGATTVAPARMASPPGDELLVLVAQVDEQRLREGQPPLPAGQWRLDADGDEIQVAPCGLALTADAATTTLVTDGPTLRWPTDRPSERVEQRLQAWLRSCDGVDIDATTWVRTVEEAPLLAAWWPAANTLLVHPFALELLDETPALPTASSRYATAEQPILATLGGCVQNLEALCGPCALDPASDACSRVISAELSTGALVVTTCAELGAQHGGAGDFFAELCVGQLIGGLEDCVIDCASAHAQTCLVQAPGPGDTLADKLVPYDQLQQRHCRDALDVCLVSPPGEDGVASCEIDIDDGSVYACMDEVIWRCRGCIEDTGESNCSALFPGSRFADDCAAMGYPEFSDSGPLAAWCAWRSQLPVACLNEAQSCVDADVPVRSAATLEQRFAPMFDPATSEACVGRAEQCWNEFSSVCHRTVVDHCNACLGVDLAVGAGPGECDPLFVGSTIAQDCLNLGFPDFQHPGLTAAYCAWQHQMRPSCLNGAGTCAHADIEARSLDTFALRYAPFVDAATRDGCVAQANACWDGQPIAPVRLEVPPWRVQESPAGDDGGGSCGE